MFRQEAFKSDKELFQNLKVLKCCMPLISAPAFRRAFPVWDGRACLLKFSCVTARKFNQVKDQAVIRGKEAT